MKKIANKLMILLLAVAVAPGCNSDMNYKDYGVTPVSGLLSPSDNYYVELQGGSGKVVTFSWEPAQTENGISPLYEVVFYVTPGGAEIYRHYAAAKTTTSMTHKDINNVANLAGIDAGQDGTIYWSVVSNNGIVQALPDETRALVVTRLTGFNNIPDQLYIFGSATEAAELGEESLEMKSTSSDGGEFEIYTKLYAGGTYNFIGSNDITYSVSGEIMEESSNPISATADGIYRITVDMNTKALKLVRITKVEYIFSRDQSYNETVPYIGNGVWKMTDKFVEFPSNDERFKFHVSIEGEDWPTEIWGSKNEDNGRPSSLEGDFWNVSVRPLGGINEWDYTWKFTAAVEDNNVDITLFMTGHVKEDGEWRSIDDYYCFVEILD